MTAAGMIVRQVDHLEGPHEGQPGEGRRPGEARALERVLGDVAGPWRSVRPAVRRLPPVAKASSQRPRMPSISRWSQLRLAGATKAWGLAGAGVAGAGTGAGAAGARAAGAGAAGVAAGAGMGVGIAGAAIVAGAGIAAGAGGGSS